MKQTSMIAGILQVICRILSILYMLTFLYAAFSLISGIGTTPYGDGKYLHINYPFTQTPFLNVDNNLSYLIFSFLLVLLGYAVFFCLSSRVFRVFRQKRIFTLANIRIMKAYYIYNIFIPLPIVILASFFVEIEGFIWILIAIHFIVGIFSLFLSNIFKQGVHLQNDQDLII